MIDDAPRRQKLTDVMSLAEWSKVLSSDHDRRANSEY